VKRTLIVALAMLAFLFGVVSGSVAAPSSTRGDSPGEPLGTDGPGATALVLEPLDASEATAPAREFTTQGPADAPQCTGPFYLPTADDAARAADLIKGKVHINSFADWQMPVVGGVPDPTWREDPYGNANWVANFQSLRWLDPLRREGLRTGNQAMLDLYQTLIHDWVTSNPIDKPQSRFSWADMVDGVRAVGLVCAGAAFQATWLTQAQDDHAAALMDRTRYRQVGNHGLNQNMGLLALGCSRSRQDWIDTANSRNNTLLERSVDEQGVTDEGSMLYELLNYNWYTEMRTRLRSSDCLGVAISPLYDRVDRMPGFLANAVQPRATPGSVPTMVAFGDTNALYVAPKLHGTQTGYAYFGSTEDPTTHQVNPKPSKTFALFTNRGYAFSRSGWYDTQPNGALQSLAAMRFGPSRKATVHGHQDGGSLSYWALGKQILWQPGVYGGGGGAPRSYVVRNDAQNVVDVVGSTYSDTATTPLSVSKSTSQYDLVTVRSSALVGSKWQRTMIHFKATATSPELLVVDDKVTQATSRTVAQNWHIGRDRTVVAGSNRAATSGSGSNATILWVDSPHIAVVKGQRSPMLGWRSEVVNSFLPTPTVQATRTGRSVRLTAVIVPRASSASSSAIKILRTSTTSTARSIDVQTGSTRWRITFTGATATCRKL